MAVLGWAAIALACAVTLSVSSQTPKVAAFPGVLDEHPAIDYASRPTRDRVSLLTERIARGDVSLDYREPAGYLPSVLELLDISPASQILVFSKTGVQRAHTSPRNPRALYFDDAVVVGYIPGARFIEIAAHDPEQGVVFYTVDQSLKPLAPAPGGRGAADREMKPDAGGVTPSTSMAGTARLSPGAATPARDATVFTRRTTCLTCHVSGSTLDVPGMIARSNFVNEHGEAIPQLGFHLVDHRTPLAQRWGGWFVTGDYVAPPYGGVGHMGNVLTTLHPDRGDVAATSNELLLRWLDSPAAERGYPAHESDIAALMVFDHQMHAINLLTRLNWEARVARHEAGAGVADAAPASLVEDLVDYLLFVDESPPPARVTPRPGFAAQFTAAGPRDSRGRSLRDLDLDRRLLRYSCSYMIQSVAFERLPDGVRAAVHTRLREVLSGRDRRAKYRHLSTADRRAISDILRETKPDWPATP